MIYKANKENLKIAVDLLRKGEVIIYPTDTLYGFGVDATNSEAILNLNKIKKREQPYSIIVNSFGMLNKYVKLSAIKNIDIKKYLPGPYTLIFQKSENNLSDLVSLNFKTIGIRIPNHAFPCQIVQMFKKPIITTSINMHNSKPLKDIETIIEYFSHINIFKDDKNINKIQSSTIIDVTNNSIKVLRKGLGAII